MGQNLFTKGPCTYDVRKISGIFDALPSLVQVCPIFHNSLPSPGHHIALTDPPPLQREISLRYMTPYLPIILLIK